MATIKGVWVFNELTAEDCDGFPGAIVNFTSNGENFVEMNGTAQPIDYYRSDGSYVSALIASSSWYWADEAYRAVDFGETEQEVTDTFYEWFTANATEQFFYKPGYFIKTEFLVGIGNAIRRKLDTKDRFPPEEMEQAIDEIAVDDGTFFTDYGMMYKRNMVVKGNPIYGLLGNGYQSAPEMETFSAPDVDMGTNIIGSVLRNCTSLKTAYLPKIRRIGNTFFSWCLALEEVTLGCAEAPMEQINTNSFHQCESLVRLNLVGAITTSFSLQWSPLLDDVSIQSIVDGLADLTGQDEKTLTFHADVGAKLTAEQKATLTAKNWTLVY